MTPIMLYGGPLDGMPSLEAHPDAVIFRLPVKDQPIAIYRFSPEWSAHFGKRVAVHEFFHGLPPKEGVMV